MLKNLARILKCEARDDTVVLYDELEIPDAATAAIYDGLGNVSDFTGLTTTAAIYDGLEDPRHGVVIYDKLEDLSPELRASFARGLAESARGETSDLGDFGVYADDELPAE